MKSSIGKGGFSVLKMEQMRFIRLNSLNSTLNFIKIDLEHYKVIGPEMFAFLHPCGLK